MFSSVQLFLFLATIFQTIFNADAFYPEQYIDGVVRYCINKANWFDAIEEKYVRKGERKKGEPRLSPPPFGDVQDELNEIEKRQRPFECTGDILQEYSDEKLSISPLYRDLKHQCESKKPSPQCDPLNPYRMINGTCNNLINPRWGSGLSCFQRLLPANYEGVSAIRRSVQGKKALPNSRSISRLLSPDINKSTKNYTTLFVLFEQTVAHDIAQFPFTFIKGKPLDCCSHPERIDQHPQCEPILIKPDDPFYSKQNVTCFNFFRIVPCATCSVEKRIPINHGTSFIDCSNIYGFTDERSQELRMNDGTGKLKVQHRISGELMPADKSRGSGCGDEAKQQYCFKGGDLQSNQHTLLMIFETLFFREHNRIAEILKYINPFWGEEKLFQEARKIVIAVLQGIIYKESLVMFFGPNLMSKYGLWIGNRTKYDPFLDPTVLAEFNAAAYRLHSLIPGKVLYGDHPSWLRNLYTNAEPLYDNKIESFLTKMADWPPQLYDRYFTKDVTNFLYKLRDGSWGFDLVAVDIERGRDAGLPTYTQVFEYLHNKQKQITEFHEIKDNFVPACQKLLEEIYLDVRDIDLFVGINCERVPEDMIIGPTAAEIMAIQFQRSKYADRYYFEHEGVFTDEQWKTLIDGVSLSKLICDNTEVGTFQPNADKFPYESNAPIKCSEIPGVDLEKWRVY